MISGATDIVEPVSTAAAALGQRAIACEPSAAAEAWAAAGTVFVGVDAAAHVVEAGFPRRDRVYLVGGDAGSAALWSMPLGAETIVLPQGRAWLSAVLADGAVDRAADMLAVLGGSGGAGASTLAAALAWRAAGRGETVVLVDVDRLGGGLDLLLGAERVPGWRWPRFSGADGVLGDLREFLPVVDGVALLSMVRGPEREPARESLGAVLGSLQRGFDRVVIDVGRCGGATGGEVLRLAGRTVLVVGGSVRGVAAAGQVLRVFDPPACEVVARQLPGARVSDDAVADALGLPVVGRLRHEPGLTVAAERGERPPFNRRRGGLGRVCDRLLGDA